MMRMLDPCLTILAPLNDKIIAQGFLGSLKEITAQIRDKWRPDLLPVTLGYRKPHAVGYWQPGYRQEISAQITLVAHCRAQIQLGATEVLHIFESWLKDGNKRIGESVNVHCITEHDVTGAIMHVGNGKKRKYLNDPQFSDKITTYNPIFNPWALDQELIAYLGIQADKHESFITTIKDVVASYMEQYKEQQQPQQADMSLFDCKAAGNQVILRARFRELIAPDAGRSVDAGWTITVDMTELGHKNLTQAIADKEQISTIFDFSRGKMAQDGELAPGVYFLHDDHLIDVPNDMIPQLLSAINQAKPN